MPKFEITIQSRVGLIGPFFVQAIDASEALAEGTRVASEFLSDGLSPGLVQQTWIVLARSETGEVAASVPFRFDGRAV